jgi:3-oxosteroid 1-dehydrogenase
VVIAGSGMAGLSAALTAADHGLKAVILEKAEKAGGGSSWSNGGLWIGNNSIARGEGISDSRDETLSYLKFLGAGHEVQENTLAYMEGSLAALDYFSGLGVPFQLVHGLPDHYYDMAPGSKREGRMLEVPLVSAHELGEWRGKTEISPFVPSIVTFEESIKWGGRGNMRNWDHKLLEERRRLDLRGRGAGLVVQFMKGVLARRVPIRLGSRVERLHSEDSVVTGVTVRSHGKALHLRARRGVLLASGGYASNTRLTRELDGFPEWETFFPETIEGDGMIMANEIGASVRKIQDFMCHFLGYRNPAPGDTHPFVEAGTNMLAFPHSIVVNRYGERFADESYFQAILNGLRLFDVWRHENPNTPCYAIFDQSYADRYTFGNAPAGAPIPDWVVRADTLQALGVKLGIDGERMQATVARFNEAARLGEDPDFRRGSAAWSKYYTGDLTHKPNANLGPLERAPYYGVKLVVSGSSSAGLLTNGRGQVMHIRGHPIAGLYASGDVSAYVEQGSGFQAGTALGRGMAFSYLAVKHMAG